MKWDIVAQLLFSFFWPFVYVGWRRRRWRLQGVEYGMEAVMKSVSRVGGPALAYMVAMNGVTYHGEMAEKQAAQRKGAN